MDVEIGVVGAGTVGSALLRRLKNSSFLEERAGEKIIVKWLIEKDESKRRAFEGEIPFISDKVEEMLSDPDVKIVVELIGGIEDARRIINEALEKRKHVVTANKALLAEELKNLLKKAQENGVLLLFEASVGAGIPLILPLLSSLSSERVKALYGIMNGTCNYILTSMHKKGKTFKEALMDAKKMGICEPEPSLDINGTDTGHKLCILASLAFGKKVEPSSIHIEGINEIKKEDLFWAEEEFGYTLKLLGIAKEVDGKIQARVHPTLIPSDSVLASVDDVYNAIYVVADECGPLLFYGRGAGPESASTAVLSDIIQIVRSMKEGGKMHLPKIDEYAEVEPITSTICRYYLRFMAVDQPGVLAQISKILANRGISIASVIQKGRAVAQVVPIVMLTHACCEEDIQYAKKQIDALDVIKEPTVMLRVEEVLP